MSKFPKRIDEAPADLPMDVTAIPAPHYSTLVGGATRTGTVLVVDDERVVRVAIRHVLQKYGYTVLEASNADDALQLVHDHIVPIDLIVTDIMMPGTTGVELVKILLSSASEIPVIYISGYAAGSELSAATGRGDQWLLAKPVYPATLMAAVQGALTYGTNPVSDFHPGL